MNYETLTPAELLDALRARGLKTTKPKKSGDGAQRLSRSEMISALVAADSGNPAPAAVPSLPANPNPNPAMQINPTPAQSALPLPPAEPAAATPAAPAATPAPAPAPAVNAAAAFGGFLAQIGDAAASAAVAAVRPELDAMRADLAKNATIRVSITLPELPEPRELPDGEAAHPALSALLPRMRTGANCYLVGPTGSGKTYLAAQAARALFGDSNEHFGALSVSGDLTPGDIFGRLVPVPSGKDGEPGALAFRFEESAFTRIYRDGGVFLFDEFDAAAPGVALVVNQAFANGEMNVPGLGRVKKHDQCYILAAGNTTGAGATRDYTGRSKLDAASLNRFRYVSVDYDTDLEKALATAYAGDRTKAAPVLDARDAARRVIRDNRLAGVFFSTRTVVDYARFVRAGITTTRAAILEDFAAALPEDKRELFRRAS